MKNKSPKKKVTVKFAEEKKIVVQVTLADIRNGVGGNCQQCPVALALRRKTGSRRWKVFQRYVRHGYGRIVDLPTQASDFIYKFDEGRPLKPFRFTLSLPV